MFAPKTTLFLTLPYRTMTTYHENQFLTETIRNHVGRSGGFENELLP